MMTFRYANLYFNQVFFCKKIFSQEIISNVHKQNPYNCIIFPYIRTTLVFYGLEHRMFQTTFFLLQNLQP